MLPNLSWPGGQIGTRTQMYTHRNKYYVVSRVQKLISREIHLSILYPWLAAKKLRVTQSHFSSKHMDAWVWVIRFSHFITLVSHTCNHASIPNIPLHPLSQTHTYTWYAHAITCMILLLKDVDTNRSRKEGGERCLCCVCLPVKLPVKNSWGWN